MSLVTCSQLQQFYTDPTNSGTEDGVQIYGDASLFFVSQGGCDSTVPPEVVYNSFCGTPSLDSNYKESCQNILATGGTKDSSNLIYHKIISNNYPEFGYTNIPQFASYAYHPLDFNNLPPPIQASFSGNVTASLGSNGTLAIAILGNIELSAVVTNVISFCMANQTGLLYYINSNGNTFSYNPLTGKSQQISSEPIVNLPIRMISAALPNIAMAYISLSDLANIYQFDFPSNQWIAMPLPAPVFSFNLEMSIDFAGTTLIFGASLTSTSSAKPYISSPFPTSNPVPLLFFIPTANSFITCAPFLIRNQSTNNFEMLSIWQTTSIGTFIAINDLTNLTSTVIVQPSATINPSIGISWSPQGNQIVCFTQFNGLFYSPVIPTTISDWIMLSSSVQTSTSPSIIGTLSITVTNQLIYWPEYIPSSQYFALRCATFFANPLSYFLNSLSNFGFFYLLDNGEIRCYASTSLTAGIIWISSTSDQNIPSATLLTNGSYVPILPNENPLTISKNGLYALSFDINTGLFQLLQNVINGTDIVTWGGTANIASLRAAFQTNYCANLPQNMQTGTITNTYPDPQCLCYNPRKLTASLFNVDLLSSNPAQLLLVDSISPCLFGGCTETRGKGTITDTFMNTSVKCPSTINLCSTIIQLGQDGSINAGKGGVNIDTNCGGSAGQTPCSSTCPVGMACASDGFCSIVCETNAGCPGAGQKCLKGVCDSSAADEKTLPDWAIALIVIGSVLLLILLAFGIYYARKKNQ
jgi:hypothetical protein